MKIFFITSAPGRIPTYTKKYSLQIGLEPSKGPANRSSKFSLECIMHNKGLSAYRIAHLAAPRPSLKTFECDTNANEDVRRATIASCTLVQASLNWKQQDFSDLERDLNFTHISLAFQSHIKL